MKGELAILNVGAGDTKLSFDPKKPDDVAHATRVIEDMLKRGYAILVQVGEKDGEPLYQRAKGFDPKTAEYIVVGTPDPVAAPPEAEAAIEAPAVGRPPPRRRGRPPGPSKNLRLAASSTRAVAVGRSAGG